MKGNQSTLLILLLLLIALGGFLWGWTCPICSPRAVATAVAPVAAAAAPAIAETKKEEPKVAVFSGTPLKIIDSEYWNANARENLMWTKNSGQFNKPVYPSVETAWGKLKNWLGNNPKRELTVTGHYAADETYNAAGGQKTLGLARAAAIKAKLVSMGVKGQQVLLADRVVNNINWKSNSADGLHEYSFGGELATNDVAALEKRLRARPITVNFKTGSSELNLSSYEQQFIKDMIAYCKQVPTARLLVEGHTDNVGNAESNRKLSVRRAGQVKDYLVKRGAAASNLETGGQGPDKPIASNETTEGKAQNRRVEISLK